VNTDENESVGRCAHRSRVERAIVFQLLDSDDAERWSRAELEIELHDVEALAISDALEHLEAVGVVDLDGETVGASRCARYLDRLGIVAV
jgi:hypothetical protein